MSARADSWIRLHSDSLTAEVDPQGAQLSVLRNAAGSDLLWDGDPAIWNGRAPILFPIVGALNGGHYRWRGKRYPLSRHGFARGRAFDVVSHGGQSLRLRQTYDDDTLRVYPFRFELDVVFALAGSVLDIEASVHNLDDAPMPASLGFHPAFRWPLPDGVERQAHYVEFEHDEPSPIRRLDAAGLLYAAGRTTPLRERRLALGDVLFTEDVVILEQPTSRSLTYGGATGPRLRLSFGPVSHLGIWTKPGAGFVCIEPWRGVADPVDFDGEFDTKPGVFLVPPGGRETLSMRIKEISP